MDAEQHRALLTAGLARLARGDKSALAEVYRATAAKLFGVCLRILGDRHDAEEVLQEVYVSVWHNAKGFDPARASPITWLVAIARNRAIDRARSGSYARRTAPLEAAAEIADTAPSAAARVEADDQSRRLHGCLGELEPQHAAAIRTAFLDGATYEELAERSGVPLGTMKSWIRRGLMRLRTCLEQ